MSAKRSLLALSVIAAAAGVGAVQAAVVFTWEPSPEPNIRSYNLYVGVPGSYRTAIPFGHQTAAVVDGLEQGKTYVISVTALSDSGQESRPSELIQYTPGPNEESGAVMSLPEMTLQPVGQQVLEGERVELRTLASSRLPFNYQWYRNGVALPEGVSDILVLDPAKPSDSGAYQVLARNAAGVSISTPAIVFVQSTSPPTDPPDLGADNPPPIADDTITPLALIIRPRLITERNTPTAIEPIEISVSAEERDLVVISVESLDPELVPVENVFFAGTGATRYLMVVPVADRHGTARLLLRAALGTDEVTQEIEIVILPPNNAPRLSSLPARVGAVSGQARSIPVQVFDPDDDVLDVNIAVMPVEFSGCAQLHGSGGERTVVILSAPDQAGSFDLTVIVRDIRGLSASGVCVVTLVQPELTVERQDQELVIRWPEVPDLALQSSSDLHQGWQPVQELPALISYRDGECRLRWTLETTGLFFRLAGE